MTHHRRNFASTNFLRHGSALFRISAIVPADQSQFSFYRR